jgi:hypothetical protein
LLAQSRIFAFKSISYKLPAAAAIKKFGLFRFVQSTKDKREWGADFTKDKREWGADLKARVSS